MFYSWQGAFVVLLLCLNRISPQRHRLPGDPVDEEIREDRLEDIPEEKRGNFFKVGEEVLALPEVLSNLNFQKKEFASKENLEQQEALRKGAYWGRLYIHNFPYPIQYFQAHFGIPAPKGLRELVFAADTYLCPDTPQPKASFISEHKAIVVALRGNCTFGKKAQVALSLNASALVIVNTEQGLDHLAAPDMHDIEVSVVSVPRDDGNSLMRYLQSTDGVQGSLVPINCATLEKAYTCKPCTVEDEQFVTSDIIEGGYINFAGAHMKFEYLLSQFGSGFKPSSYDIFLPRNEETKELSEGCSNYTTPTVVKQKMVVVRRGGCKFIEKAKYAEEAGAAGLVILNFNNSVFNVISEPRWSGLNITLPVLSASNICAESLINQYRKNKENMKIQFESSKIIKRKKWGALNELANVESWPRSIGAAKTMFDQKVTEVENSIEMRRFLDDIWINILKKSDAKIEAKSEL